MRPQRFRFAILFAAASWSGLLGGAASGAEGTPLVVPLAGDWNGDGTTDVGWLNTRTLEPFFLELLVGAETVREGAYTCHGPLLPGGRSGLLPIAGDWYDEGRGLSEIGLFDPVTREFLLYRSNAGGSWQLAHRFPHPVSGVGGLPVVGDWDGDLVDEVGLYVEEEQRFLLLDGNHAGAGVREVLLTDLHHGDWAPVAGDWGDETGFDVVAVWNAATRELRISHANTSGPTWVPDEGYTQEGPGLLPFSGRWGQLTAIGFYDPGTDGHSQFVLYPCDFGGDCGGMGGREPILRPPPEDPIVASCASQSF
jgi:hypothetical protein